jgi:hypothetical protein
MIAWFYFGDPSPHPLDHAGSFVPEDTRRWWDWQMPIPSGEICVANANCSDTNQHLIISGFADF